jgi:hypothetical protein
VKEKLKVHHRARRLPACQDGQPHQEQGGRNSDRTDDEGLSALLVFDPDEGTRCAHCTVDLQGAAAATAAG